MHFTGTVYRNPYWPTWPLLEITQGCTHNRCKFCTMFKDVPFRMSPIEWIEEDLGMAAPMRCPDLSADAISFEVDGCIAMDVGKYDLVFDRGAEA